MTGMRWLAAHTMRGDSVSFGRLVRTVVPGIPRHLTRGLGIELTLSASGLRVSQWRRPCASLHPLQYQGSRPKAPLHRWQSVWTASAPSATGLQGGFGKPPSALPKGSLRRVLASLGSAVARGSVLSRCGLPARASGGLACERAVQKTACRCQRQSSGPWALARDCGDSATPSSATGRS